MMGLHLRVAGQPTAGLRALISGIVCFSRVGQDGELPVLVSLGAGDFLLEFVDKGRHDSSDVF